MIVTNIELWPHGDEARGTVLVQVVIANVGGNAEVGDYSYAVSHQFGTRYAIGYVDEHLLLNGVGAWKRGSIKNFRRQLGAAKLLAAVLKDARL